MSYTIEFIREGITYQAEAGQTILEAEIAAGLTPDAPCGGKGRCGKCKVRCRGQEVLACQTVIESDLQVDTEVGSGEAQILLEGTGRAVELQPGDLPEDIEQPLLAAVDIGSTSVVVYLLDGHTGEQLAVESMLNPQRQYGADVVMRGSYAMEKGAEVLSSCIRKAVNTLLTRAAEKAERKPADIVRITMVGNSCMHHLFLEIPVDSLMLAPYEPKVKEAVELSATDCGLTACPRAEVAWLPNIGGFVGADTVGCVLSSHIYEAKQLTLMVDIGTNGEMVLGDEQHMTACSTAAGPAFEGAKITCGMRGSAGAIDHVWLEQGELQYHVIGDCEPTGICGSGLLDAAACLCERGDIDEGGRMEETCYFTEKVFLNQKDVRELQLAKAAICAGIRLLCKHQGVKTEDICALQIAGAFGNYLNPDSACAIGLIPPELRPKIQSIGNAAGEGAKAAVLNRGEYEKSKVLAREIEFLELAMDPEFQDVYVDELAFPGEE